MKFGKFHGDVIAKWLRHRGDDRNMELCKDFSYTDPDGKSWPAKKGRTDRCDLFPGFSHHTAREGQ